MTKPRAFYGPYVNVDADAEMEKQNKEMIEITNTRLDNITLKQNEQTAAVTELDIQRGSRIEDDKHNIRSNTYGQLIIHKPRVTTGDGTPVDEATGDVATDNVAAGAIGGNEKANNQATATQGANLDRTPPPEQDQEMDFHLEKWTRP